MTYLKAFVILAAFAFAFAGVTPLLLQSWSRNDYSHGVLVPFISLYIAWIDRARLKATPVRTNIAGGLAVMAVSALMLALGRAGGVLWLQEVSIVVMVPGVLLALLGRGYLRALALPLGYLALMVPVFDPIIARLHWPFQLLTAVMSSKLLSLYGIPLLRNLQYIEFPNVTLEVADECSGVNYLVSIIAIGIPLAHFTQRAWPRRLMLLALAVVIGIAANTLRVTLIGLWAYYGGEVLHGPYHILKGFFVSVVGFFFLFLAAWFMRDPVRGERPVEGDWTKGAERPLSRSRGAHPRGRLAWAVVFAFLAAMGVYMHLHGPVAVPLRRPLEELPLDIGGYVGSKASYLKEPFRVARADAELMRVYKGPDGLAINVYVGYIESQSQGKELIYYDLRALHDRAESAEVALSPDEAMRVNVSTVRYGAQSYRVLFWYALDGGYETGMYRAKALTALDGMLYARTNGALVMAFTAVDGAEDGGAERLKAFAPVLAKALKGHLP
jgi:EpsI family protein